MANLADIASALDDLVVLIGGVLVIIRHPYISVTEQGKLCSSDPFGRTVSDLIRTLYWTVVNSFSSGDSTYFNYPGIFRISLGCGTWRVPGRILR